MDVVILSPEKLSYLEARFDRIETMLERFSGLLEKKPEGLPVLIGRKDAAKIIRKSPNSVDAWAERNGVQILSKSDAQKLVRGGQAVATKQGKPEKDATAYDYYFFESEVRRAFEG